MNFENDGKCSDCGYYLNDHRFEQVEAKLTLKMICPKPGYVSEWNQ